MIYIENTGLNHVLNGMACKWNVITFQTGKLFPEEEDRDYDLCCNNQLVLADATGIANQNDVSGFMFKASAPTDTIALYLEKDEAQIAALNSSTYGTYYALGSIVFYPDQDLLSGYILNWSAVRTAHGIGNYRIRLDYTTYSGTTSSYSNNYILRTFSNEIADKTIRIESYMDGYMMRERINYKGLNFVDMIRVSGWFGNPEEKIEVTNDIFANQLLDKRVVVQRKVNQMDTYIIETLPLPKCIADRIRYYHFFGNTVYMSDYNILNYDYDLKRIRIYKDTAFDFKYTGTTRGVIIKGKLTEMVQDMQKTNC